MLLALFDSLAWVSIVVLLALNVTWLHTTCSSLETFQYVFIGVEGSAIVVAGCFTFCLQFPPQALRPHPATARKWWICRHFALGAIGVVACGLSGYGFYLLNSLEVAHCLRHAPNMGERYIVVLDIAIATFIHIVQLGYVVCLRIDPNACHSEAQQLVFEASLAKNKVDFWGGREEDGEEVASSLLGGAHDEEKYA